MNRHQAAHELLSTLAQRRGISRRDFLRLMGIGGAGAVLAACGVQGTSAPAASQAGATAGGSTASAAPAQMFFKSEEPFLKVFATELGTRWDQADGFITPVERFYVRNRYASPKVESATWRLKVSGDGIEQPMEFSYDELLKLPSKRAPRYMECFGNGRTLNWEQLGYDVKGGNWGFSAISMGEWDYIPIAEILDRVKLKKEAVQLLFWSGVDGKDTGRPMPIEEILARPDVIGLAHGLNGQPLHGDHGGPVRALVPGWGGAASVKWLTEIRVSTKRFWTRMHTKEESLIGPEYKVDTASPDDEFLGVVSRDVRGTGATWLNVKSFLTIPLVIRKSEPPEKYPLAKDEVPVVPGGQQTMRGYASSPWGVKRVEYSVDSGATWQDATLAGPGGTEYTWSQFEFPWNATPGNHILMTRATDNQGNTQPDTIPFNELGVLCNVVPKFEVLVK